MKKTWNRSGGTRKTPSGLPWSVSTAACSPVPNTPLISTLPTIAGHSRFVQSLVDFKLAVLKSPFPSFAVWIEPKACRITHKGIYRELGDSQHPPPETRRSWPPISGGSCPWITSSNTRNSNGSRPKRKRSSVLHGGTACPKDQLPKRIYTAGRPVCLARYFHLKLPIAGGRTTTFVYVDPGNGHLHRAPILGPDTPACVACRLRQPRHHDSCGGNRNQSLTPITARGPCWRDGHAITRWCPTAGE